MEWRADMPRSPHETERLIRYPGALEQRFAAVRALAPLVLTAVFLGGMVLGNYLAIRKAVDCALPKPYVIEPHRPAAPRNVTAHRHARDEPYSAPAGRRPTATSGLA
jgi:hypothetical protein